MIYFKQKRIQTYHANGADSGSVPVDPNEYEAGQEVIVRGNTGNLEREGFIFTGWNSEHDGSGIQYGGGSSLVMSNSAIDIYAQWYKIPTSFSGGSGTEDDPFQVETAGHLYIVRDHLDKHFIQTADIDLSAFSEGEGWDPIGAWYGAGFAENEMFVGSYNGNGYTISNLNIDRGERNGIGLFGYVGGNAIINSVRLEDINVEGKRYVGGLIGRNESSGDISHCSVSGSVSSNGSYVGGFIGRNDNSNIYASHATTNVTGGWNIGGLIGKNSGDIFKCFATGDVTSGRNSLYAGGFIGFHLRGSITSSYATGDVTGGSYTGGLVGSNWASIIDSYARGNVEGTEQVGGLVGNSIRSVKHSFSTGVVTGTAGLGGLIGATTSDVESSYYDRDTSGRSDSTQGTPKSTTEMMQKATFEDWDFDTIWAIDEGNSYPYLRWQEE